MNPSQYKQKREARIAQSNMNSHVSKKTSPDTHGQIPHNDEATEHSDGTQKQAEMF